MNYLKYSFVPILFGTLVSAFIIPSFAQQMQNPEVTQQLKESNVFKDALQTAGNTTLQDLTVITIVCSPDADLNTGEGCNSFIGLPLQ